GALARGEESAPPAALGPATVRFPMPAAPAATPTLFIPGATPTSIAADNLAPVSLELDAAQSHRCGRQSLLRLRLSPQGLTADATAELTIASALLREPFVGRVELAPGHEEELP